jgi:hypothetical protein
MYLPDDTFVSVSSNDDFMILKFDADGNLSMGKEHRVHATRPELERRCRWTRQCLCSRPVPRHGRFLRHTLSSSGGEDIAILKMDGDGDVVWANKAGGNQRDVPFASTGRPLHLTNCTSVATTGDLVTYGSTTIDDVATAMP